VPGHEIIGRVVSVGPDVTRFKPGDHVGVGCMVDSCQRCAACEQGMEQYCDQIATFTYNHVDRHDHMLTYGGYSEKIVVSEKFVLKVPDGLDLKGTAPLLCAGITTWSPLRHWKVDKGSKVGVIGLGGLGHMAIKLAKGLGADVTLFTRSPGKQGEVHRLGTDHVVLSTDDRQMAAVKDRSSDHRHCAYVHDPIRICCRCRSTVRWCWSGFGLELMLSTVLLMINRKSITNSMIDHRRNPRAARLLRQARHHLRYRSDQDSGHKHSVRTHAEKRCEIPLCY
jgi:uncharacterized zinc-type alcohol dehydrogenase-like protein